MRGTLALSIALAVLGVASTAVARPFFATFQGEENMNWRDIHVATSIAWMSEKPDDLERLLSVPLDQRTADGRTEEAVAYRTLEFIANGSISEHPSLHAKWTFLDRWQARFPASPHPEIIRAIWLAEFAMRVPERTSQIFPAPGYVPRESALLEAQSHLDKAATLGAPVPSLAHERLKVAILRKQSFDDLFVLVDAARQDFPGYREPQFTLIDYAIADRAWEPDVIEGLVSSFAHRRDGEMDYGAYAELYVHILDTRYRRELFRVSLGKWSYLRTGFAELAKAQPQRKLAQHRAAAACLAGDVAEARAAFADFSDPPNHDVWQIPRFFEDCRTWVKRGGTP